MSKQDVDRTPVAHDIWCYSPKEKAFTWHVVVNHDAQGYVDRVQCKVSGYVHKYKRQNKTASASSSSSSVIRRNATGQTVGATSPKAKAASIENSASLEQSWFDGIKAWGDKPVLTYAPDKFWDKGDVLEHPVFGKGVVQVRRDNKVDVLFRVGLKTLPTARKVI
jgi:hypothetical protein